MTQDYTADRLELSALQNIPLVEAGDDLADMIVEAQSGDIQLQNGDVLVVAQKIVSKAEGRLIRVADVEPSDEAISLAEESGKDARLVELILQESSEIVRQVEGLIIARHKLGFVMANAGIDQSNVVDGTALLLPIDPDASAAKLRATIKERHGIDTAVVISDSIGRAWRNGIVGHAIGVSGMSPVLDLRESEDLFGRELRVTEVAIADEIAAAATLLMGQGREGKPVVLVRGLHVSEAANTSRKNASHLVRDKERDLFP